jgi:plasmid maintenance system antidote protein VapI
MAKAPQKLKRLAAKIGATAVAVEIGIAESYLYHLISGERTPGLALACRLWDLYGIDPREWK